LENSDHFGTEVYCEQAVAKASLKFMMSPSFFIALDPLLPGNGLEKGAEANGVAIRPEAVKGGLTILTAAIFLAGEMAGSGVLALPYAILGTGN
jgi:hypothetical protein